MYCPHSTKSTDIRLYMKGLCRDSYTFVLMNWTIYRRSYIYSRHWGICDTADLWNNHHALSSANTTDLYRRCCRTSNQPERVVHWYQHKSKTRRHCPEHHVLNHGSKRKFASPHQRLLNERFPPTMKLRPKKKGCNVQTPSLSQIIRNILPPPADLGGHMWATKVGVTGLNATQVSSRSEVPATLETRSHFIHGHSWTIEGWPDAFHGRSSGIIKRRLRVISFIAASQVSCPRSGSNWWWIYWSLRVGNTWSRLVVCFNARRGGCVWRRGWGFLLGRHLTFVNIIKILKLSLNHLFPDDIDIARIEVLLEKLCWKAWQKTYDHRK